VRECIHTWLSETTLKYFQRLPYIRDAAMAML
jgi:hypothetical protein